jgi:hypothetical protein
MTIFKVSISEKNFPTQDADRESEREKEREKERERERKRERKREKKMARIRRSVNVLN